VNEVLGMLILKKIIRPKILGSRAALFPDKNLIYTFKGISMLLAIDISSKAKKLRRIQQRCKKILK